MIGRTILHYTILEKLGDDRRGQAYLADDPRLRRRVVLEFPSDAVAPEGDARDRFLRRARAAAKLSHPNIAALHAVEEIDGRVFVAVEHVDGAPLGDMARRGRMQPTRAIDIAGQIAAALAGAHECRVVHRHLTSDHVLVTGDGRVKVVGFGLPDGRGAAAAARPSPASAHAYASPEQTRGGHTDHRSDLFAFGVILREMLTGRAPSSGGTAPGNMAGVPDGLVAIVEKSLEPDPDLRYQGATEILADLARL